MNDKINIEVVYALPDEQILLRQSVPAGTTVLEAVRASGMLAQHPEINLASNKLGIFGKLTHADVVLRDKDRIEIYRPLIADPKEVRRKRAEQGKAMTAGGSLPAPRPPAGRASGGVPFTGDSGGVPTGGVNSAQPPAGCGLPTFSVPLAGTKNGGEI
jgi:putative ubiquitin-RnfH superfamily antitoxin RatB of RatAB toxin-antitoxin module